MSVLARIQLILLWGLFVVLPVVASAQEIGPARGSLVVSGGGETTATRRRPSTPTTQLQPVTAQSVDDVETRTRAFVINLCWGRIAHEI